MDHLEDRGGLLSVLDSRLEARSELGEVLARPIRLVRLVEGAIHDAEEVLNGVQVRGARRVVAQEA